MDLLVSRDLNKSLAAMSKAQMLECPERRRDYGKRLRLVSLYYERKGAKAQRQQLEFTSRLCDFALKNYFRSEGP